ncbi:SpoIID/LytB domain-containing protein [Clostridium sp. MB40-C1]|uniref:SpoIID/LytB domain-containing protein n=1 Tax=Clostridium sp. MB40-C1 TaxID=3070996 RepID=UPI0027E094EC|nr:SpoIID/LytB domain-containing protein [Clostridium sp. MB40-C1]WMJ80233.1 SpoIID/LytB domain-containing protein [Clostridium sp. MB40-C1]
MKKPFVIVSILFSIIIVTLFFPRKITHAIILESTPNYTLIYTNNKIKKIKFKNSNLHKYTVADFKFNYFKVYSYQIVTPSSNRILRKTSKKYELEHIGLINLSKNPSFYKIDENNNITIATSKDIIVGKNNVKSFLNKNELKTFVIYPMKDYSNIRVGISDNNFTSIYHKEAYLQFNSAGEIYNKTENIHLDIPKYYTIKFKFSKGKINVYLNGNHITSKNRLYISGGNIEITNIKRGSPTFNPSFSGILELYPSEKGLIIINEVKVEEYLTKVVPSEMPVWGGIEALKCQSVAARTYAMSDMLSNRYSNLGFHVDDSTRCQVYNNTLPQNISNKAVKETTGTIMTYDKSPIDAKYYSTSCGTGVNYKDIWFKSDGSSDVKPYLKTNVFFNNNTNLPSTEREWLEFYKNKSIQAYDKNSPYFRWSVTFGKKTIEDNLNYNLKQIKKNSPDYITLFKRNNPNKKLNRFPKKLKNLKDIQVLTRSDGGNIIEISFLFDNAIVNVKNDSFIRRSFKCTSPPKISLQNKKFIDNWNTLPSSFFSIETIGDSFTIYGGGYGHGVGMSQYGAMYLGKKNVDFKTILNTYYKDIDFTTLYK